MALQVLFIEDRQFCANHLSAGLVILHWLPVSQVYSLVMSSNIVWACIAVPLGKELGLEKAYCLAVMLVVELSDSGSRWFRIWPKHK